MRGDGQWPDGRVCEECGERPTEQLRGGVDPCLGVLPGVISACCGHGVGRGFILFENGTMVDINARSIVHHHAGIGKTRDVEDGMVER